MNPKQNDFSKRTGEVGAANLFDQATAHIKQQRTEKNKVWIPEFARFKLQFIYRNGSTSIPYHSYDIYKTTGGVNVTDEQQGWSKLLKLVEGKKRFDEYVVATIWCKTDTDLRTYIKGVPARDYDFQILKHVRNQPVWVSPLLNFNNRKLDIMLIQKHLFSKQAAKP